MKRSLAQRLVILKNHAGDFYNEEMSLCVFFFCGVHAHCCMLCVHKRVFAVMCATLCHHATVLLHSQGQAIIIAASDSIMIQFYLLHRGPRGAMGTLEMDNLLHCQEMYAAPSFYPRQNTHTMPRARRHTAAIPNKYVQLWLSGCKQKQKEMCIFLPPFFFLYFSSCDVSLGRGSINSITLGGELASCYIRNMALWISHQTTFL